MGRSRDVHKPAGGCRHPIDGRAVGGLADRPAQAATSMRDQAHLRVNMRDVDMKDLAESLASVMKFS
jgi:hypothetical protein